MLGLLTLAASILINVGIGLIVASQSLKESKNILFVAITACFTVLVSANTLSLDASLDQLFFIRVVMFTTTVSLMLLYFLIISIQSRKILRSWLAKLLLALTILVSILDWSPVIFSGYVAGNPPEPTPGFGFILFPIHFILTASATIYSLWMGRKNASFKERQQYNYILLGLAPILSLAPLTSIILPQLLGLSSLVLFSPLYTTFFVACIGYAILKHGLFDIKLAAVRTIGYAMALIVLAVVYYLFAYLISMTLFSGDTTTAFSTSPINILLAIGLAFIFQPIKSFFDKITDSIFFRDRYNSDEFYARFNEVLTSTTDLRTLLQRAAGEIGVTLKTQQTFFFVQYNQTRRITAGTHHHSELPLKDIHSLDAYINLQGTNVIVRDTLTHDDTVQRLLTSHKVAVLMPLVRHKEILGYLCLGEHQAGGYTSRDIKVLDTISNELVIAIQNSLSVQEVRDINANLEQRIETATAELRTSNARLKRLDAAKDEFLSMASHQLRTPLTSVKGYLSMMLEGDVGKVSPMQKQVLEEAFSSSERMVHLIHDFLNVSRLQTGKFMLEMNEVNLSQLVSEEIKSLEKVASSRNMKLSYVRGDEDIIMKLDDTKMRQVVMNYIDNAIFYSHPDTTIIIELAKTDKEVVLKVKDTGIGVPKSEQEHLFGKFYRASNARKQRPDGTGVGIYLAKKVVTALGGDIVFESKEGKGSTFGFRLPVQ